MSIAARTTPLRRATHRRRSLVLIAAVLCLLATTTGCEWPENTRYVNRVFDNVTFTGAIPYRTTTRYDGSSITLALDVYRPTGDTATDRPAVMWMHGGSWISGNRSNMASYASDSARRGYVGVSISYRLRPNWNDLNASILDAYDDAVAAVAWLKANAATYGIDPDLIVAGGASAGAINAMNLVYMPGTRGPATSPVAGAVSLMGASSALPNGPRPPVTMHHGTADTTVPFSWAQDTCNNAISDGNICDFTAYEGVGHNLASVQAAQLQTASSHWIWETVVWASGRQPEYID